MYSSGIDGGGSGGSSRSLVKVCLVKVWYNSGKSLVKSGKG